MKCYCNVDTFTYETLEKDNENNTYNKVLICTCGTFIIDGKKKTRCEFYNKKVLKSGIIFPCKPPKTINCNTDYINTLPENETCRKDINWRIHLIKIALNYPDDINISNHISVINYNLRKLEYKPFFPNKECIEDLISRLDCKPDDIRLSKTDTIYKTKNKTKIKTKTKTKTKNNNGIQHFYYNGPRDNIKYEDEEDEYSDNSDENGETFDVDCYDSMDDLDYCLEEEAFSD